MSVFIFGTNHHHLNHELFQRELINCSLDIHDWEKEPLTENSLIVAELAWINPHELSEAQIENAKQIKNKRILLIIDFKSFYIDSYQAIEQVKYFLNEMNFNPSDVYIITQIEYDACMIRNSMPDVNITSRDRWLKELFQVQVTPYTFSEGIEVDSDLEEIPNKRFSLFIRRHEKLRFEFMCTLLAMGLHDHLHYTFANTEELITNDQFKEMIPEKLSYAKDMLERWVEGIPYNVKPGKGFDHPHYPVNLKHYFKKSDINIVLETNPNGKREDAYASYITEKTYKAMLFKKPFILVSEKHALKALRVCGFKTFSPWIDESYDEIDDFDERVQAILAEIKKISLLSNEEMTQFLHEVNEIIEHNHKLLYEIAYTPLEDRFKLKSLLTF